MCNGLESYRLFNDYTLTLERKFSFVVSKTGSIA